MDTIIDTRQFPKEMEEKPQTPRLKEKNSSSFIVWLIFFLVILFGGYYLYTKYYHKEENSVIMDVEKQNEFIQKVVENKKPLPSSTYKRNVAHLFGE